MGWVVLSADGLGAFARFSLPTQDGWWSPLVAYIQSSAWLQYLLEQILRAWPYDLTFLRDPFMRFSSTTFSFPILMLFFFLNLAAVVRRARDAGWRPWLVALLTYWHIIGTALIVVPMFALASISEAFAWMAGIAGSLILTQNWLIAIAAALISLFALIAPSVPGPNPHEVQS